MLLNWVVVVMTNHAATEVKGDRGWSQRSIIPVHHRTDAERMADAINTVRNQFDAEGYTAEVCVQIPAQKGNVLLTVHAVEELIKEWNNQDLYEMTETSIRNLSPGEKRKLKERLRKEFPEPVPSFVPDVDRDEDEPA